MPNSYEVTTWTRVANWITGRMAALGVGNFAVLTTTGRSSGEPRRVTLAPISDADGEYLVSPYGNVAWVLNARAQPMARLREGRSVREVLLVDVTGTKPDLVKEYYDRESFARRFMDVPPDADVAAFASVGERFPVFRIEERR
ncbi:MAG: nitroreductase/quinone reductase family protein [Acidimicrobiia bacterium]